ncbi:hypothetical protein PUN28_005564 [Cardiocondyla obscurior]|uniref:Uncharacterized protein n=1 Tax=Cardiocondyla obscurior TaxID=286306 RepID=A0AAW2GLI3_9HYME
MRRILVEINDSEMDTIPMSLILNVRNVGKIWEQRKHCHIILLNSSSYLKKNSAEQVAALIGQRRCGGFGLTETIARLPQQESRYYEDEESRLLKSSVSIKKRGAPSGVTFGRRRGNGFVIGPATQIVSH